MKSKKGIWKLIVGIFFTLAGFHSFSDGPDGSLLTLIIGIAFVAWWYFGNRKKAVKLNIAGDENDITENSSAIECRDVTTEVFSARGVVYYLDNVKKLACCNPDWKKNKVTLKADGKLLEKIYRYNYIHKPVKLVEEPTNEYDKNAVQIIVAGELVGYIPAESALHVKDILKNHEIKYISSFISGGEYKIAYENGIDKHEENIKVKVKIAYI